MMTGQDVSLFRFLFSLIIALNVAVQAYCPACERNNQFNNLMTSLRPPNVDNNQNNNYWNNNNNNNWNTQQQITYPSTQQTSWTGPQPQQPQTNFNSFPTAASIPAPNTFQPQTATINTNSNNFQNFPFRIINTVGYGCCMNTFGPCCNNAPAQFVIPTFQASNNNFGTFQSPSQLQPQSVFQPAAAEPSSIAGQQFNSFPQPQQQVSSPVGDWPATPQIQSNHMFVNMNAQESSFVPQPVEASPPPQHVVNPGFSQHDQQPIYRNPYGNHNSFPNFQFNN